jgi:hypothetical protein
MKLNESHSNCREGEKKIPEPKSSMNPIAIAEKVKKKIPEPKSSMNPIAIAEKVKKKSLSLKVSI